MAGSARGVVAAVGLAIGLGAAATLLWNEWRLARSFDALAQVERSLAAGDGRALRVSGKAEGSAPARDPLFGIETAALRLDRIAETHQWREHREGSGDNKILRYERVWSPVLIPSRRFEQRTAHANPSGLAVEPASFPGGEVRLAGFLLDPALVRRLPATRELFPDRDRRPVAAAGLSFRRAGDWLYSGDADEPAIGDVRVRFAAAPSGVVTVIGAEVDGRLVPWQTDAGQEVGLAAYGDAPTAELLG
jgi:hypothetical protein